MSTEIQCPACRQRYAAPDRHAGKEVPCPACKTRIRVPHKNTTSATLSQATDSPVRGATPNSARDNTNSHERINGHCEQCGRPYQVDAKYAGRKMACPQCNSVLVVPFPTEERLPELTGPLDLLAELDDSLLTDGAPLQSSSTSPQRPFSRLGNTSSRAITGFLPFLWKTPLRTAVFAALGGFVVFLILLPLFPFGAFLWSTLCSSVGLGIMVASGIWLWVIALRKLAIDEIIWLLIWPFGQFGYVRENWKELRQPTWMFLIGTAMAVGTALGVVVSLGSFVRQHLVAEQQETHRNRIQHQQNHFRQHQPATQDRGPTPPSSVNRIAPNVPPNIPPAQRRQSPKPPPSGRTEEEPGCHLPAPSKTPPDIWHVVCDPLPDDVSIPDDLSITLPQHIWDRQLIFPWLPSRVVAIGTQLEGLQVVDLSSQRRIGQWTNDTRTTSTHLPAVSPDGKLLAIGNLQESREAHTVVYAYSLSPATQVARIAVQMPWMRLQSLFFCSKTHLLLSFTKHPSAVTSQLVQIWDVPTRTLIREYMVPGRGTEDRELMISPTGKYLVSLSPYLAVYELSSGELVGARPFPKADDRERWTSMGAAFSPDGKELAALFDVGRECGKLVVWNLADGAITAQHTVTDTPFRNIPSFWRYTGDPIEWFAESQGWLLGGHMAVDRASGSITWQLPDMPPAVRLMGNKLVGILGSKSRVIRAYDVSIARAPDVPPLVEERSRTTDRAAGPPVIRFDVLGFRGNGDQLQAAQKALRHIPWIVPNTVSFESPTILKAHLSSMSLNSSIAKEALTDAGFQLGGIAIGPDH